MKKRILALCLALTMVIGVFGVIAVAEEIIPWYGPVITFDLDWEIRSAGIYLGEYRSLTYDNDFYIGFRNADFEITSDRTFNGTPTVRVDVNDESEIYHRHFVWPIDQMRDREDDDPHERDPFGKVVFHLWFPEDTALTMFHQEYRGLAGGRYEVDGVAITDDDKGAWVEITFRSADFWYGPFLSFDIDEDGGNTVFYIGAQEWYTPEDDDGTGSTTAFAPSRLLGADTPAETQPPAEENGTQAAPPAGNGGGNAGTFDIGIIGFVIMPGASATGLVVLKKKR